VRLSEPLRYLLKRTALCGAGTLIGLRGLWSFGEGAVNVGYWHMSDASFNRPRVGNVAINGTPETTGLCTLDHRRSLSAQCRGMGHG
jgi:hypothetical protein